MWVLCAFFEAAVTITKPASCLLCAKHTENQPSNTKQPIRPIKTIVMSVAVPRQPKSYRAQGISPALRPVGGNLWPTFPKNYITLLLITVARASLILSTPSLRKSFLRWYFIVSTVRKSREAISSVV